MMALGLPAEVPRDDRPLAVQMEFVERNERSEQPPSAAELREPVRVAHVARVVPRAALPVFL